MNKSIFVLLCLFGLALSLRISHSDSQLDGAFSGDAAPPKTAEEIKAQEQANLRLLEFIQKDYSLRTAFSAGKKPNKIQLQKLMGFMVNDPFFQERLFQTIRNTKGNQFTKNISRSAMLRYLKIVASVAPEKLNDPAIQKSIAKRLLKDEEIGKAIRQQNGENIDADFYSKLSASLNQPTVGHFMALLK